MESSGGAHREGYSSPPFVSPGEPWTGGGCSSHLLPVSFLCALDRLPLGLYSSPHLCNDTWGSFQLRWVFWEIIDVLWRGSRLWEVRSFMGVTAPWKETAALWPAWCVCVCVRAPLSPLELPTRMTVVLSDCLGRVWGVRTLSMCCEPHLEISVFNSTQGSCSPPIKPNARRCSEAPNPCPLW